MGALHSEPRKFRSPLTGGVSNVACVPQPSGPRESIECVRYSPTAASTPWMTPGDSSNTASPSGTFQPAEVLPQRTSARAEDACASSAATVRSAPQSRPRDVAGFLRTLQGRNRKAGVCIMSPSPRPDCNPGAEVGGASARGYDPPSATIWLYCPA